MKKDIQNEIEEMAPILSSIAKQNPYKVPEAYFEELTKKNIDVDDIPKEYFDRLPDLILEKIESEETQILNSKPSSPKIFQLRNIGIAASILLLITISTFWKSFDNPDIAMEDSWEGLPIVSYLEELEEGFDSDIFLAFNDVLLSDELEADDFSDIEIDDFIEALDESDLETLLN